MRERSIERNFRNVSELEFANSPDNNITLGISVIICCYTLKRLSITKELIKNLLKQKYIEEILLVVDYNEDLYVYLEKRFCLKIFQDTATIRVLRNQFGKGLSGGRNTGILHAKGAISAFIDDDAVTHENWSQKLIQNFKDVNIAGVGGKIVPDWKGEAPPWFSDEINWIVGSSYLGLPKKKQEVRNVIGANMAFRSHIFKIAGLFTSILGRKAGKLLSGEETEFCIRVREKTGGMKIVYDPEVIVYHKIESKRRTIKYMLSRCFYEGVSKKKIKRHLSFIERESKAVHDKPLDMERNYAMFLIRHGIFSRISRITKINDKNKRQTMSQIIAIVLVLFVTGFGYLITR